MSETNASSPLVRHYFVDEAGDGTLFDSKGRVIAGSNGCSSHFILGMLDVAQPTLLSEELEALRRTLLADPFFKKVPSMQAEQRKTALLLHANGIGTTRCCR